MLMDGSTKEDNHLHMGYPSEANQPLFEEKEPGVRKLRRVGRFCKDSILLDVRMNGWSEE